MEGKRAKGKFTATDGNGGTITGQTTGSAVTFQDPYVFGSGGNFTGTIGLDGTLGGTLLSPAPGQSQIYTFFTLSGKPSTGLRWSIQSVCLLVDIEMESSARSTLPA